MYVSQNKHTQPIRNKDYLTIRQSTRNSNKRKELSNILKSGINCYTSSQMIYLQRNA